MNQNIDPDVLDDLLMAVGGRPLPEASKRRLQALHWSLMRRPILFQSPSPGVYVVGDPDAPVTLECGILAGSGVQLALANPGRFDLVRAADFAAPGVEHPDISVRSGIKRFATFLENNGQRVLASLVLGVQVVGGYVVAPARRQFELITE